MQNGLLYLNCKWEMSNVILRNNLPVWTRKTSRLLVMLAALLCLTAGIAQSAAPMKILVLGDSLSAGYGLAKPDAFPVVLETALKKAGHSISLINAGVSGDTTAGGRARLGWALADKPAVVIWELGANDGLRGLEPSETRSNLDAILSELGKRDITVLLAGMLAPPNLGKEYGVEFNSLFPALAQKHNSVFYRFFLDGVAGEPQLNQQDGIHPNRAGVDEIVHRILPRVMAALNRIRP